MTLDAFIADKPIKHIIIDFGGTLLQRYSFTTGYEVNLVLRDFIVAHARDYCFTIWSHSPHEQIMNCLKNWQLDAYFSFIISLDNMIEPKPSPASFTLIADPKSINPKEWLLIGDSDDDGYTAAALGLYFFKWV